MKVTIAIDLGGTAIKAGLVFNGKILHHKLIQSDAIKGLQSSLPLIDSIIGQMLQEQRLHKNEISGVGFSFAGLVDSEKHHIISTNQKYDDGPEIDLRTWANDHWNCPLFLENDARMALLGEWQYGAGKHCNDLVMITLGTGVGTAVLMDGRLLKGRHFQAGNLGGHFVVNYDGMQCTCGNIGCVESEASTWRLPALIQKHPGYYASNLYCEKILDFETLFRLAAKGDQVAFEIQNHCFKVWSACIINMIHAFDPEKVILSGGIMESANLILPVLQKYIDQYAWTPSAKVPLVKADHIRHAALYGADFLVTSNIKNK